MKNVIVDFGHSSIKACDNKENVIFLKNIISKEAVPADISSFTGAFDESNYAVIKYKGETYSIGEHAEKCKIKKQNTYDDDVLSEDTHMMITAAIAYMQDNFREDINLYLNLPSADYRRYKEQYLDRYDDELLSIEVYDYEEDCFTPRRVKVKNIDIKKQGFYSLIHYVFDEEGQERKELRDKYRGLCVTLDIGYYSTDVVITDDLKPRNTTVSVDGMKKVYDNIADSLKDELNLSKKAYELENYIVHNDCKIDFGTEVIDISEAVQKEYEGIVDQIIAEMRNEISTREVRTWFLTGGGATPLAPLLEEHDDFKDKIEVISSPRYANCFGGMKWADIVGQK